MWKMVWSKSRKKLRNNCWRVRGILRPAAVVSTAIRRTTRWMPRTALNILLVSPTLLRKNWSSAWNASSISAMRWIVCLTHRGNVGNTGSQLTTQRRLQWYNPLLIRVKPKPSIFRGKALCWKVLRRYSLRRKRKSGKRRLNAVFMRCSASTEGPAIPRPDHRQHCPSGLSMV